MLINVGWEQTFATGRPAGDESPDQKR
jgi:hypothetical protein